MVAPSSRAAPTHPGPPPEQLGVSPRPLEPASGRPKDEGSPLSTTRCETRAAQLLTNLGFSDELQARPMSALSGGWRVRTALAAAIFGRPDMLLLDEPTNHLSIGAVLWLARELTTNPVWEERVIVVVSHDRYFLDEVCGEVLHVSGVARRLTQSHGSYSTWSKRRAEQQKAFAKQVELRRAEIAELKEYAGHGFKYGGSSASINKMKMKEKQAEKLEEEDAAQAAAAGASCDPAAARSPAQSPRPWPGSLGLWRALTGLGAPRR